MELKDLREKLNIVDKKMAELFEERMHIINEVALVKQKQGLPTQDPSREKQMVENNSNYMQDKKLVKHYIEFLQCCLKTSRDYQNSLKTNK